MHAFSIFVFAPVQRNWACFTWKSALEIRSLLLLLFLLLLPTYPANQTSMDQGLITLPFCLQTVLPATL